MLSFLFAALVIGAQDVSQLDDLRPLIVDPIKNVIDIERCNDNGFGDLLAEQQFLQRHRGYGINVFRGCERGNPRDQILNADYVRCCRAFAESWKRSASGLPGSVEPLETPASTDGIT